jgi:hypothetical protein
MPTLAARTDAEGGFGVTYFELLAHRAQGSDVVVRAITDARSIYLSCSRIARGDPTSSSLFANEKHVRSSLLRSSGARLTDARS